MACEAPLANLQALAAYSTPCRTGTAVDSGGCAPRNRDGAARLRSLYRRAVSQVSLPLSPRDPKRPPVALSYPWARMARPAKLGEWRIERLLEAASALAPVHVCAA